MQRLINPSAANTSNHSFGNLLFCSQFHIVVIIVSDPVNGMTVAVQKLCEVNNLFNVNMVYYSEMSVPWETPEPG